MGFRVLRKLSVTPTIQFSNHLVVAFKKIYELKGVIPVKMIDPVNYRCIVS